MPAPSFPTSGGEPFSDRLFMAAGAFALAGAKQLPM